MGNICAEYSGVVIDQNVVTASLTPGGSFYYQEFRLPEDYLRGVKSGQTRFPGISGFQLLTAVAKETASTCSLNYTLEQHNFGNAAWEVLAKGTVTGAQAEGERIWIDVILSKEIPVDISMTSNVSELRIGFQIVSGIEKLYYAQPNPLPGFVEALQSNGKALLSPPASFAFRLLALTADNGTDFLGDPYRSVAIHSSAQAPVGENTNSGFWLSAPQPSKFAVTSHYSDLRVFPSTPSYGVINEILDPSFEYDVVGESPFEWGSIPNVITKEEAVIVPPVFKVKVGEWRMPLQATLDMSGSVLPTISEWKPGEFRRVLQAVLQFNAPWTEEVPLSKITVIDSIEAVKGKNVLEVVTPAHTHPVAFRLHGGAYANNVQVITNKPKTFSIWMRCPKGESFKLSLVIGNNIVGIAEETVLVTPEWQRFSVTLTPIESGEAPVAVLVPVLESVKGHTFYLDGAMVNAGLKAAAYIDGDSSSCKWENQHGRSASVELIEPKLEDNAAVIDSIILDPITPGVAFNIYYTNDLTGTPEGGEMTEEQWEQKLWVHIPQSYVTSVKTTYVLPEPITAKFIKIEFSHLQARPYEPGDYQKPTGYKLFPDWAATPFLAELSLPAFTSKRVGVVYDALELGYKPLIEDLIQGPSSPEHPTPTPSIAPPASNRVDPETLRRIETTLNTYLKPPAARANPLTLLGARAATKVENAPSYPVEGEPQFRGNTTIAVSGLDRQAIVLDESMPVIFFWVTCRHEYKELNALFENDRAYFAGIKELAFLRSQFSVAADTNIYVEAGTDDVNTELSDFNVETFPVENDGVVYGEESVWFAY
jgi:hypothetical protein